MNKNEWSKEFYEGNMFLLDSASFYIAARHLLLSMTFSGVKPGLVNGAYSLEYLLKGALVYSGITFPKSGRAGHNLFHLANLLDSELANSFRTELNLFYDYFNSRYFTHKTDRNGLYSGDVSKLDSVYQKIYEHLNIPLEYHYSVGLLVRASLGSDANDFEAFEKMNEQYNFYDELNTKSLNAAGLI